MWMFSFRSNMSLIKFNFIFFFLTIGYIESGIKKKRYFFKNTLNKLFFSIVKSQCSSPFTSGDVTNFCYYYGGTSLSWLDGYNQCLSQPIDGILLEIFSIKQFNALKTINIDGQDSFWLGANDFASCK